MTRQNISTGTTANDGTGDTLRSAGTKINQNFVELYQAFGTDSSTLGSGITFDTSGIVITGTTNTTTVTAKDPGSDVTFQIPDSSGEAVILSPDNIVYLKDSTGAVSKIYYGNVFADSDALPNATTYHGMFAHVHDIGRGVFAHAGSWRNILDSDTFTSITDLQLINPKMDTTIFDNTGTFEILQLENVSGSPANYLKIDNSLTSVNPVITADGDDVDVGVTITPKGNEVINLKGSLMYEATSYTGSTGVNLDSDVSNYQFSLSGAATFTLHNGRYVGETKKFINSNIQNVTIFNSNGFRRPGNSTVQNMTIQDVNFVNVIWDGSRWILDRGTVDASDITFA